MEIHWIWMFVATLLGCYNFTDKIVRNLNEWYYDFKFRKRGYPLPPGDMGWPIIGNMWPFFKHFSSGHPDEFVNNIVLKYGKNDMYKTHLYGFPSIPVTSAAMCKKVMTDDENFEEGYPKSLTKLVWTRFLSGEHKYFKRIVTSPIVGQNALVMYIQRMEDIIIDKLEELSSIKYPVEFLNEMKKVSFKIIFHIFLGSCDPVIVNKFGDLFNVLAAGMFSYIPIEAPGLAFNRAFKARKKLVKILQSIVEERKAVLKDGQIEEKKDLLDILLEINGERGEKLEVDDIIDFLITLLFGGHDILAIAMMWSITYLSEHPLCLKKAKEEQEDIMKARPSSQKRFCIKETKKKVYLSQVIDETLRHVDTFSTFREAKTDVNVNGYFIPKGWKVLLWLRAIHMDPEYHSNPEEFNPERWNDYNPTTASFLPFGIGSRHCPGSDLARLEMTIFLHYFILNYKFERINPKCPLTSIPIPKPTDNCLAKVIKLSGDLK